MNVDDGTALDQPGSLCGIGVVEHAKTARPPVAAGIDVGAKFQQRVDHLTVVFCGHDGLGSEREKRPVDVQAKSGSPGDERPHRGHVPRSYKFHKFVDLGESSTIDEVLAHLRGVLIEHAHRPAPELAAHVDVGAKVQQHVDHRAIAPGKDNRWLAVKEGLADRFAQVRMRRQQRA